MNGGVVTTIREIFFFFIILQSAFYRTTNIKFNPVLIPTMTDITVKISASYYLRDREFAGYDWGIYNGKELVCSTVSTSDRLKEIAREVLRYVEKRNLASPKYKIVLSKGDVPRGSKLSDGRPCFFYTTAPVKRVREELTDLLKDKDSPCRDAV